MKYIAKKVDASVNLPDSHPLADLAWMAGGLAVIMAVLFLSGGLIVDQLAKRIPQEYDNAIGDSLPPELFTEFGPEITEGPLVERTQSLFEQLRKTLPADDSRNYALTIIDTDEVNALALPGSHIVVFRGLLEKAQSQNEVAMVLAHEFGHVYHRHHWRKLGRSAVFAITAMLVGSQSAVRSQLAAIPLATMMQANSRSHESESDRFALDLVCRHYGHSGGTTDFFARNLSEEKRSTRLVSFLLTHPLSQKRVDDINARASANGCLPDQTTQWSLPQ